MAVQKGKKGKKALLLGAGGPLGGLEAGALIALSEKGVDFDVVSGACIGSILSLAYTSPANGLTPVEALHAWCEMTGVADPLYKMLPVNFKIFTKDAGPWSGLWDKWSAWVIQNNPFFSTAPKNQWQRLYNDMFLLWVTSCIPSTVTPDSMALSRITRGLENLIDFEKLPELEKDVYINALNITDREITLFGKKEITPDHVIAGSSLYYIAKPTQINGKWYAEGSYIDSLNYKGILKAHKDIDTIVVMNILNKEALIRLPTGLDDAYNLSVMLPFVTIAEDDTKIFEDRYKGGRTLLSVDFEIPDKDDDHVCDWSYSNFQRLKEIGYKAGLEFYQKHKDVLMS